MTYHEISINISEPIKDALIRKCSDWGSLGVIEQEETLIAYFPESVKISEIINELVLFRTLLETAGYEPNLTFKHTVIEEQDWNESWKKGFVPIDVGEHFTILPPWERTKENRINLIIDPAMAFGTGHHETTRSCLVLMEEYVDKTEKDAFLDLGTGTGVLAIAASKLGYQRILGIDTDPLAIEAAEKNCKINDAKNVELKSGSLPEIHEEFDIIAANLISGVLIQLAPALSTHLKQGGIAFLSGILMGQEDKVIQAAEKQGLKLTEKYKDGKWASLVFKK
jgi:ribosomal protein L11 methyltransferase